MPGNNGRDLLLHGLKDMYDAEHRFAEALTTMADRTKDRSLTDGFRRHREVTKDQIRRLEECFEAMGTRRERVKCTAGEGLVEGYRTFVQGERPDAAIHDLFAAGAALKVEHYEIAAYATMIDLALRLDLRECANLLTDNLREEEAAAAELEMASRKLGAEVTGSGAGLRGAIGTLRAPMRSGGIGAVARAVGHQAGDMVERLEERGRRARTTRTRSTSTGRRKAAARRTARASATARKKTRASRSSNGRRTTTSRARATGSRSRTTTARGRSTARRTTARRATSSTRGRATRRPASRTGTRRTTTRGRATR